MRVCKPVLRTILPAFRRAYPSMIANQIVGVQPMSQPSGFVFALKYKYVKPKKKKK